MNSSEPLIVQAELDSLVFMVGLRRNSLCHAFLINCLNFKKNAANRHRIVKMYKTGFVFVRSFIHNLLNWVLFLSHTGNLEHLGFYCKKNCIEAGGKQLVVWFQPAGSIFHRSGLRVMNR